MRPRVLVSAHPAPLAPPAAEPSTRSLVADADHWVATDAVRQAIGAWAYTLPAGERRPGDAEVREAVALAGALRESVGAERAAPWGRGSHTQATAEAALNPADLADRTGLAERVVAYALDLLRQARVVAVVANAERGATVSIAAAVLSPQPCVARLAWHEGRERLQAVGASMAPALAVWREIASAVGAYADGTPAPPVRQSVRALEERTGYGRSTVAEALAALERARLLDLELRAGRTARLTLRPASFGRPDLPPLESTTTPPALAASPGAPAPVALPLSPDRQGRGVPGGVTPSGRAEAAAVPTSAAPGPAGASTRLGEFAGIPIFAPPGTPIRVECDAAGHWLCRVGPFLVLGPVAPEGV